MGHTLQGPAWRGSATHRDRSAGFNDVEESACTHRADRVI